MRRFSLWLGRIMLAAVVLPLLWLMVMTLIAFQVGAVSAIFLYPGTDGPFDGLTISEGYIARTFQITGLVLAYELYLLFILIAFPFLLATGNLRWGIGS